MYSNDTKAHSSPPSIRRRRAGSDQLQRIAGTCRSMSIHTEFANELIDRRKRDLLPSEARLRSSSAASQRSKFDRYVPVRLTHFSATTRVDQRKRVRQLVAWLPA